MGWFKSDTGRGKQDQQGASYGPQALVRLSQVTKVYHTGAGQFTALRGVDLDLDKGEFAAIVGKSGSGKSTLLNMLTGIDHPSSGDIWVCGQDIQRLGENRMAQWRGKNLGIVFQFFQLLPMLSVLENVMLPMDFCEVGTMAQRPERAMALLNLVGMADVAHKIPSELSGGQQQRVAIARSLANDPALIVADEPTGNLDSRTADAVFDLFAQLASRGKTILMVTHDRDLASRVERTITIEDGLIASQERRMGRVVPLFPRGATTWQMPSEGVAASD